jgi:hypothetical protein
VKQCSDREQGCKLFKLSLTPGDASVFLSVRRRQARNSPLREIVRKGAPLDAESRRGRAAAPSVGSAQTPNSRASCCRSVSDKYRISPDSISRREYSPLWARDGFVLHIMRRARDRATLVRRTNSLGSTDKATLPPSKKPQHRAGAYRSIRSLGNNISAGGADLGPDAPTRPSVARAKLYYSWRDRRSALPWRAGCCRGDLAAHFAAVSASTSSHMRCPCVSRSSRVPTIKVMPATAIG